MINKRREIESLILKLLASNKTVSLKDIAQAAGLSPESEADRRNIQRALASLTKQNRIQSKGAARARVYYPIEQSTNETQVKEKEFNGIPLSEQSHQLLQYLTQPIQARKIVGYQQDFLRSYEPNKTAYLSDADKEILLKTGLVEHTIKPAGTYARHILNRLLIDLAWNSSRLEGNTYSLLETKRLIEIGETASGKDLAEAQMILNHKNAIEYIIDTADDKKTRAHDIYSIHALLSENLLGDPSALGRIREILVNVSGTTYIPPDNPHILKEYFDMFVEKFNQMQNPFEQSFFSLVHLSYLQTFEDVNKRTSRLVANIPFIKQNLKPLSFIDVNQESYVTSLLGVYERNDVSLLRDFYIWAYKRSAQRYSAFQQNLGELNFLKMKYRQAINEVIRYLILNKVSGDSLVPEIKQMINKLQLTNAESTQIFEIIESEIICLHEDNIARFKVSPSEFADWHKTQKRQNLD